jgi:hypothetical protein
LVLLLEADPFVIALGELQVDTEHLLLEVIYVLCQLLESLVHLIIVLLQPHLLLGLTVYFLGHALQLVAQGLLHLLLLRFQLRLLVSVLRDVFAEVLEFGVHLLAVTLAVVYQPPLLGDFLGLLLCYQARGLKQVLNVVFPVAYPADLAPGK